MRERQDEVHPRPIVPRRRRRCRLVGCHDRECCHLNVAVMRPGLSMAASTTQTCLAWEVRRAAASPREPQLPPQLDPGELDGLRHDANVSESELAGVSLVDQSVSGVTFGTVRLADVDLSGSRLEHLRITDGALRRCNLANVHAARASLNRVTVEGSRMTGIAVREATLRDVSLRGCRI